jgi:DNA-binding MarR family transcriptional regulator
MAKTSAPKARRALITADQEQAWFAMLYTHSAITEQIDAVLMQRHRISFSAFEILCRLNDCEPQAVRTLASQLVSVSPTRASRLMQELVDAGHLQRGADQTDGRISLLSFTDSGREYAGEVHETFEAAVKEYFADPLDDEDIAALTRIWAKLSASRA